MFLDIFSRKVGQKGFDRKKSIRFNDIIAESADCTIRKKSQCTNELNQTLLDVGKKQNWIRKEFRFNFFLKNRIVL